jgi:hypothetical protein
MIHIGFGRHIARRLTVPSYSIQGWLGTGTMIKEAFIVMPSINQAHGVFAEPFPLSFVAPFSFVPLVESKLTQSSTVDNAWSLSYQLQLASSEDLSKLQMQMYRYYVLKCDGSMNFTLILM